MSQPQPFNPKALREARAYIPAILRVCLQDCSDSGTDADRLHARFDGLVDDAIQIGAFIQIYLLAEWRAEAWRTMKEAGYTCDDLDEQGWPVEEPPAPLNDIDLLRD